MDVTIEVDRTPVKGICCGVRPENINYERPDTFILVVFGNPGISKLYKRFMLQLHDNTGWPVWGVDYLGFSREINYSITANDGHLYDLDAQVKHHTTIIKQYLENVKNLYLIGHSTGAHIILSIMGKNEDIANKVRHVYLLCPMMEDFPNLDGTAVVTPSILMLEKIIVYTKHLDWLINAPIIKPLGQWLLAYFTNRMSEYEMLNATSYHQIASVAVLTFKSYDKLRGRPHLPILKQYANKIFILYGENDEWGPAWRGRRLKAEIPELDVQVDELNMGHSFQLQNGARMADFLTYFLTKNLKDTFYQWLGVYLAKRTSEYEVIQATSYHQIASAIVHSYKSCDRLRGRPHLPTLKRYANKIFIMYGEKDEWGPAWRGRRLKAEIPELDVHVDELNMGHSFQLRNGARMADFLTYYLRKDLKDTVK